MDVRKGVLVSYFESILMFISESWTIRTFVRNYLEARDVWFCRRVMRIPWKYAIRSFIRLVNGNRIYGLKLL